MVKNIRRTLRGLLFFTYLGWILGLHISLTSKDEPFLLGPGRFCQFEYADYENYRKKCPILSPFPHEIPLLFASNLILYGFFGLGRVPSHNSQCINIWNRPYIFVKIFNVVRTWRRSLGFDHLLAIVLWKNL